MPRRPLRTRYLGTAPDLRHPLAPPEHVFAVEEGPPLRRRAPVGTLILLGLMALAALALLGG